MPQPVPICFAPKYPPPADNLVDARVFVGQKFILGHTWPNIADDFVANIVGHRAARIMLERRSGPTLVWCWYINRIKGNIDKLEEAIKAGKVKNTGAWLARAIEEDYRDQKSLFQVSQEEAGQQAKARKEDAQRRAREVSALEIEMELQEQAYLKHRQEFMEATIHASSAEDRAKWEVEFGERLEGFFKRQWNIKPEWGSKITLTKSEGFILEKTGQACLGQAEFTKGQGWPSLEELQKRREALL